MPSPFPEPMRASIPRLLATLPLLALAAAAFAGPAPATPARELRVCADPNNLPFSNDRLQGFENRLAELVAREMGAELRYTWWAQRRGFFRSTLKEGRCDVVMGVPSGFDKALTTRPYYRSTYAFVHRRDRGYSIASFDAPILRTLRIGVQVIGDDGVNTPPAHALARRGIVDNVIGYTVYGDYTKDSPAADVLLAAARGEIDVAVAWGPFAGYFARRSNADLVVTPVSPATDGELPMAFDIAVGVRRKNVALRDEIDRILDQKRAEVDAILADYGVPRP